MPRVTMNDSARNYHSFCLRTNVSFTGVLVHSYWSLRVGAANIESLSDMQSKSGLERIEPNLTSALLYSDESSTSYDGYTSHCST